MMIDGNTITMVLAAQAFATAAHGAIRQIRKYTGEPYIVHPREVVRLVTGRVSWEGACAAWLHDVVEDTGVDIELIEETFGDGVALLVHGLTNVRLEFGNRKARFEENLKRLSNAADQVHTIKLADLIDNTSAIVQHDPKFALVYLKEKELTLDVLIRGDRSLRVLCEQRLRKAWQDLEALGYERR